MLSIENYKYLSWQKKFPNGKVILEPDVNTTWLPLFSQLISSAKYTKLENQLSRLVRDVDIYPYPDLVYLAFKLTRFDNLNVVIIGQDPYFNSEKGIPQAMGLSYSVPLGINIPSSLDNIYKNMMKFGHISTYPKHGNLEFLAYQGCLFLNTALTVTNGEKNSHSSWWVWFTDDIIKNISSTKKDIIFVLWGSFALEKLQLIDTNKHQVIISSHPSGLSFNKPLKNYPAFKDNDHFGQINSFLKNIGKHEIIYGL